MSVLYGAECSLSPFSEGFPATFFSNSTHLEFISSTGGRHIGSTDCFFLLSFEPKIFEGTSLNSSGVVRSSKPITEAKHCLYEGPSSDSPSLVENLYSECRDYESVYL